MAKAILFRTPMQEKEARLVHGTADGNRRIQNGLYAYCADYFWNNYRGVFFAPETMAAEILQNSFVAFWEKIENRKIIKNYLTHILIWYIIKAKIYHY